MFFVTLIGISLIIASGCVLNNLYDSDIDKLMERTKNRLSAKGLVSSKKMVSLAFVLGMAGLALLLIFTNTLTVIVALIGWFFYVVIYTMLTKRNTTLGTAFGSISGAVPPVVGYCAANNIFDSGAMILFVILCFWQMPHSYAIAIFRLKDYTAAKIPVLPVKLGIARTKISMLIFTAFYCIAVIMPSVFGYTGWIYFIAALASGLYWLYLGIKGFSKKISDQSWARKMFFISIINIMLISFMMAFD